MTRGALVAPTLAALLLVMLVLRYLRRLRARLARDRPAAGTRRGVGGCAAAGAHRGAQAPGRRQPGVLAGEVH
jgi:hypothetical protein